jgi:hypothetical protein
LNRVPLINNLFESDAPPVIEALKVGSFQLYKVPFGTIPFVTLVGDTTNISPLHDALLIAVISAVGLTVTSTVNVAP